jgi:2-phospho-L-lactate guanylyltransferase
VSDGRADLPRIDGTVVLVPVKAFSEAKERLAPLLDAPARARVAKTMAERVVAAAAPLRVAVVCDDPEVAAWAVGAGALVLPEPGLGLDGAVEAGRARLEDAGADEVLVVHADLPHARGLARLAGYGGITLVPDRRDDGTNVIGLPAGTPFRFAYGAGSFARHRRHAEDSGRPWRVVREPELEWDVDLPADVPAELLVPAGDAADTPTPPAP